MIQISSHYLNRNCRLCSISKIFYCCEGGRGMKAPESDILSRFCLLETQKLLEGEQE